jgi:hypothetical protein
LRNQFVESQEYLKEELLVSSFSSSFFVSTVISLFDLSVPIIVETSFPGEELGGLGGVDVF